MLRVLPISLLLLAACTSDPSSGLSPEELGTTILAGASCDTPESPTCPGAAIPDFALEDIQPESVTFGQTLAITPKPGRVTFVGLLAAW